MNNGCNVGDSATSNPNRNPGTSGQARGKLRRGKFSLNCSRNIFKSAIEKMLSDSNETGKLHSDGLPRKVRISGRCPGRQISKRFVTMDDHVLRPPSYCKILRTILAGIAAPGGVEQQQF